MIKKDFKNLKKIHFIGVSGISMSGLAKFLLINGVKVSGSDLVETSITKELIELGLVFYSHHSAENIDKDTQMVVFSGAIKQDNVEILKARDMGIEVLERSEFLGLFSKLFKNVLAISGSHGKTTTTAFLSKILLKAGLNPTIALGGEFADLNTNFVIGKREYLVCEACEYRESFNYLNPTFSVITNVEAEHLDYYKTKENVEEAFVKFGNLAKNKIVCFESCKKVLNKCNKDLIVCGKSIFNDYSYIYIEETQSGQRFKVLKRGKLFGYFEINLKGEYNLKHALLSIAVSDLIGVKVNDIRAGLLDFKGVKRRNELIGKIDNVSVVADYAHHPTEIKNSLKNAKEHYGKVLCIFQPHTFSRTKTLMSEFMDAFNDCDNVFVFKTYPAREKYNAKANGKVLCDAIKNENKKYFANKQKLIKEIFEQAKNFNLVLVLGAGDIYEIIKKSLNK